MKIKNIIQSELIPNAIFILGWVGYAIISICQIIFWNLNLFNINPYCLKCDSINEYRILLTFTIIITLIYSLIFIRIIPMFFNYKNSLAKKYSILFSCFILGILYFVLITLGYIIGIIIN
jgi:hypothetical protein